MNYKNYFKILVSSYLILATSYSWYGILINSTIWTFLNALFPSLVAIFISIFFLFAGIVGIFSKKISLSVNLLKTAFFLQVFQVSVFDFVFQNYLGPYIGIGFIFHPVFKIDIRVEYGSWFANGYDVYAQEMFFVNLFPLLILFILSAFFNKGK